MTGSEGRALGSQSSDGRGRSERATGRPSLGSEKYATIVVDPPWPYNEGWPAWRNDGVRRVLPYEAMNLPEIADLNVGRLLESEGYLFLWTTSRYLEDAYILVRTWGCTARQVLTWCKPPRGEGPGGMFATTTEFVIVAQKIRPGTNAHGRRTNGKRIDTSWFQWPRRRHSEKPEEFYAMVEQVSPGPYLDMFARRPRLGWDVWGDEAPNAIELPA